MKDGTCWTCEHKIKFGMFCPLVCCINKSEVNANHKCDEYK